MNIIRGLTNPVYLIDESGDIARVDSIVHALQVIDVEHHEIHEGSAFLSSYRTPDASPVANDESLDILLITGNTQTHLVAKAAAGGDAEFTIYEAPAISANGTALAEINRNRMSTRVSKNQTFHTPTVVSVGTELLAEFLPGGSGFFNTPGASEGGRYEFILKSNTVYLFRLTNRAGSAQTMSETLDWYEED